MTIALGTARLARAAAASTSRRGAPLLAAAARRRISDSVRGTTIDGSTYKVSLKLPKVVGVQTSRGERTYLEDATDVCALELDVKEIALSLQSTPAKDWDPATAGSGLMASQVSFFGIFDGHGGKQVSSFLQENLAKLVESVSVADIPAVVESTAEWGGYFRRWRGGALRRWTKWAHDPPAKEGDLMTLDERLTLAFLKADQQIKAEIGDKATHCGSTASLVLLHSLDGPGQPHWAAKKVHLTMAQLGDTRALLCNAETGEVVALTDRHHAETRIEADRLRRMGTDRLVQDSFGETRWMGAIENTRGFGDFEWKSSGVTAEPEVTRRIIDGTKNAYIVLVTDGITSLLSDQEIVDLARNASDPSRAAKTIVHFGEDLGAQDNCTCVIVPLAGWGEVGGVDTTESRREYRRQQAGMLNTRMQRM